MRAKVFGTWRDGNDVFLLLDVTDGAKIGDTVEISVVRDPLPHRCEKMPHTHRIAFRKLRLAEQWAVTGVISGQFLAPVTHCPWCGAKLELLK